jgi:hypothetical protein
MALNTTAKAIQLESTIPDTISHIAPVSTIKNFDSSPNDYKKRKKQKVKTSFDITLKEMPPVFHLEEKDSSSGVNYQPLIKEITLILQGEPFNLSENALEKALQPFPIALEEFAKEFDGALREGKLEVLQKIIPYMDWKKMTWNQQILPYPAPSIQSENGSSSTGGNNPVFPSIILRNFNNLSSVKTIPQILTNLTLSKVNTNFSYVLYLWLVKNGISLGPGIEALWYVRKQLSVTCSPQEQLEIATAIWTRLLTEYIQSPKSSPVFELLPTEKDWYQELFPHTQWYEWSSYRPQLTHSHPSLLMGQIVRYQLPIPLWYFACKPKLYPVKNCTWSWLESHDIDSTLKLKALMSLHACQKGTNYVASSENPNCKCNIFFLAHPELLCSALIGMELNVCRYLIDYQGLILEHFQYNEFDVTIKRVINSLIQWNQAIVPNPTDSYSRRKEVIEFMCRRFGSMMIRCVNIFSDVDKYSPNLKNLFHLVFNPWYQFTTKGTIACSNCGHSNVTSSQEVL